MKSILVTGANGQLGESIRKADNDSFPFECTYIDMADLTLHMCRMSDIILTITNLIT